MFPGLHERVWSYLSSEEQPHAAVCLHRCSRSPQPPHRAGEELHLRHPPLAAPSQHRELHYFGVHGGVPRGRCVALSSAFASSQEGREPETSYSLLFTGLGLARAPWGQAKAASSSKWKLPGAILTQPLGGNVSPLHCPAYPAQSHRWGN